MIEDVPGLPDADQLFDEFPTGLLVTNTSGTVLKVNKTFCTWVGMERDELVGKKRLQELFTMGGRIFHQTHWLPTLQMQGSLSEVKLDVRHQDGYSSDDAQRQALRLGNLFLWDVDAATGARRYEDDVARLLGHGSPRPVDDAHYAAAVEPTDRERTSAMPWNAPSAGARMSTTAPTASTALTASSALWSLRAMAFSTRTARWPTSWVC